MPNLILSLKDYGVARCNKTIFSSVTLDVPDKGIINIMGPTGTGKSILIRTLAGINASNSMIKTWGEATYHGSPLGQTGYPAIVMQSAKLMASTILEFIVSNLPNKNELSRTQQRDIACQLLHTANLANLVDHLDKSVVELPLETMRHLAILRVCAANPGAICLDEPTVGIHEDNTHNLLQYLKKESTKRAVLVITHNLAHAQTLGGRSVLLSGGKIHEDLPTEVFFSSPESIAAKEFIESDTGSSPSTDKKSNEIEPGCPVKTTTIPVEINNVGNDVHRLNGFVWLREGEIAGMSRPGMTAELEHELKAIKNIGITHMISLTSELDPIDPDILSKYNISSTYEPIEDMGVPTVERASFLCEEIGHLISKGHIVAIHCKAGLGRTGTLLALHLIWEGCSAHQALETVRKIEPRWVQSEEQVIFLEEFARESADNTNFAIASGNDV